MSLENVELTRRLNDAFNRRDVGAAVALSDPEIMWSPPAEAIVEGRTVRGHAGVRQYYEDLAEISEESHAEFPDLHDLGDQVLGLGRARLRFTSGVELDQEIGCLWTWRNGKCVEWRAWRSHAEALEAAVLSEQATHHATSKLASSIGPRLTAFAWAAYESGRPVEDWPTEPVFLAAVDRWKVEARERLQRRDAEARDAASGEPVTPESMRRDAEELGLHIADPVGQRDLHPS